MPTMILKAHYDGQHIQLDEPRDLPLNSPLIVTLLDQSELSKEIDQWKPIGIQALARAYGGDEPEYSVSDIKS
ncbi:MAG: hypothetical protein HY360_06245 [Verrucomicrobia bacterium]|nr:hypothetical protein [Verrucomicrobiota bacterium]